MAQRSRTRQLPGALGAQPAATQTLPQTSPQQTPARPRRIQTFWCERADRAQESLRRCTYGATKDKPHTNKICHITDYQHGHSAVAVIGEVDFSLDKEINGDHTQPFDHADVRWPTTCSRCAYVFVDDDLWLHDLDRLYRRADTGELVAHDKLPAGASYDAVYLRDFGYDGSDGVCFTVVLPDGTHWHVDSEANNCTRKGDKTHKCWVRDGDPRACNVTAGKDGNTCSAGAGSIASPGYHGFLRNGWLEEC